MVNRFFFFNGTRNILLCIYSCLRTALFAGIQRNKRAYQTLRLKIDLVYMPFTYNEISVILFNLFFFIPLKYRGILHKQLPSEYIVTIYIRLQLLLYIYWTRTIAVYPDPHLTGSNFPGSANVMVFIKGSAFLGAVNFSRGFVIENKKISVNFGFIFSCNFMIRKEMLKVLAIITDRNSLFLQKLSKKSSLFLSNIIPPHVRQYFFVALGHYI